MTSRRQKDQPDLRILSIGGELREKRHPCLEDPFLVEMVFRALLSDWLAAGSSVAGRTR